MKDSNPGVSINDIDWTAPGRAGIKLMVAATYTTAADAMKGLLAFHAFRPGDPTTAEVPAEPAAQADTATPAAHPPTDR